MDLNPILYVVELALMVNYCESSVHVHYEQTNEESPRMNPVVPRIGDYSVHVFSLTHRGDRTQQ